MGVFIQCLAVVLAAVIAGMPTTLTATRLQAFKGDLLIKDLFISNPFEADPTSSYNATMSVIVVDEDHLDETPKRCQIEWKAGVSTPDSAQHQCENNTLRVWFPKNSFRGVGNFQLQLVHTTIDSELGPCPQYCHLTKYAAVNLTHPETTNYDCDMENAVCLQRVNTTITAPVYLAIG